jgi:hypothetical protein
MAALTSGLSRPSSPFTSAAAFLTMVMASTIRGCILSPLMGKFSIARTDWSP